MFARKSSPFSLVAWAMGGAMLPGTPWFLQMTHVARLSLLGKFLIFLPPMIIGVMVSLLAQRQFELKVKAGVWSGAQLAGLRSILSRRYLSLTILAVALMCMLVGFVSPHEKKVGAFFWVLYFPYIAIESLRRSVAPPVENSGGLLHLRNAEPLQSSQWVKPANPSDELQIRSDGAGKGPV